MKVPCVDCITFSMCKQKHRLKKGLPIPVAFCPIVVNYIDQPCRQPEHPMYRRTRINKLRKVFGLKKFKGR